MRVLICPHWRTDASSKVLLMLMLTGKSNLTFEEALESEDKARKRIGNLPKVVYPHIYT